MSATADSGDPRRRVEELEAEVARLRGQLADEQFGASVRETLTQAAATAALTTPAAHTDLLDEIVATAAYVLRAQAASLFLIDEDTEELIFAVTLGEKAAEVKQFRLPVGQGIAGFTAATGQAIAIADVQKDQRWAQDIGRAVDYIPKTMLAVPLIRDDRVVGVLQLLDKDGGKPFGQEDIETASRFATQAAVAIEQSRVASDLTALVRAALRGVGDNTALATAAAEAAGRAGHDAAFLEILQIATTLGAIGRRGDAARRMCAQIVEAIDAYLHTRPGP